MSNWKDDEIRTLLTVRADAQIVRQIQGTARDSVVYDQITKRLRDRGVIRAKAQVNSKLKTLKRQYHQVLDHNGRSGNDRKTWCYFGLCEAIWGPSHPAVLAESAEAAPASGSAEAAPASGSAEAAATRGPETLPASGCLKAAHSDTDEQAPYHETDASVHESGLSTESSCHSPPKKKRRNQTRSERLTAEIRELFSEMDKDFNERERLRLLEQREYEEQVRREARVEKAQEMAVLQDITTVFRQMVQQMPALQPQYPHSAHTSWNQDPHDQRQGPTSTNL